MTTAWEHVAPQAGAWRFEKLARAPLPGAPAGVEATFGKQGDAAIVQAVHVPASWPEAEVRRFLTLSGYAQSGLRLAPVMRFRDSAPAERTALHVAIDREHTTRKVAAELQLAFGWFYVVERADGSKVVDWSGDVSDLDSLERAGYGYALDSRKGGVMHQKDANGDLIQVGRLCTFEVVTPEKRALWGVTGTAHKLHTGLWGSIRLDDVVTWNRVKSGELSMFSIGGFARVQPL